MALEKNEKLAVALGQRIKELRTAKGLTRQDVAFHLNIERKQLALIEDGDINTSVQMVYALATMFEISLAQLMDFEVG